MKKALFITLALVLVAGFAVGAYAEERLKLSGEYRVRGFYTDNFKPGGGQSTFENDTSSGKANNLSYFDQRFRLGGSISPAISSADLRHGLRSFGPRIWMGIWQR